MFLIALLRCVVGVDLLLVCLQNRLLQLQLRGVGQGEKQIAVLLLPVLPGIGFLGHGDEQSFPSIHDFQVLDHKHPIQGDGGNCLHIAGVYHPVDFCFDLHVAPQKQ